MIALSQKEQRPADTPPLLAFPTRVSRHGETRFLRTGTGTTTDSNMSCPIGHLILINFIALEADSHILLVPLPEALYV
jgi:hypothetical protein